ncbi:non-ribosomal peptide synthetase [Actinoplanes sp. G11-F43]|uniref:non-ribosomal peptide synthetase n=1 Tax=Actinoplanes sp. G11-F43 TaxID=3424130 RepID=UPI003D329504
MSQRLAALPASRRADFLARLRAQAQAAAGRGPTPRRDTGPVPLSTEQQTLRFLDERAGDGSVPGEPLCVRLRGDLDVEALRSALTAVVARHDALRTTIVRREGVPVQVVAAEIPVELPLTDVDGADHEQRLSAARALAERLVRTPPDPGRAPAWWVALIRVSPDDHLFLLDVSRMVCDDWSLGVLARDLADFYRSALTGGAARSPERVVQYPDYALWRKDGSDSGELDDQVDYWRATLAGAETLEFPTDRPRGDIGNGLGAGADFTLGADGLDQAGRLAREEGTTPADVLRAVFLVLLRRYSGLDDLVIGYPVTSRRHESLSAVAGQFTNLMPLRVDVSGDPTFRELVRRVGRVSEEASEHHALPFGRLVEAIDAAADPSRPPVFPILFDVRAPAPVPTLPGLVTSLETIHGGVSRFDMSWRLTGPDVLGGSATLAVDFDTALFDAESIARLVRHYDGLLRTLTAAPDDPLSAAEMLSPADRRLLAESAHGRARPVRDTTIVEQFEACVRETPDAVAVVVAGVETSYAELNARANRLAALLRERGVTPGARAGLCLRRNLDLIVAILAILKTGVAYVPLDTTHPAGRVAEIAADAGLCTVLAHAEVAAAVSQVRVPVLTLDDVRAELAGMPDHDPAPLAKPGDVAYVIYTSGSTGKPKGVLIEHRGVVAFTDSTRELFEMTPKDRILGFASVTFDVSVFEIFSALLTGARLYLATEDERLSVDRIQALMERSGITVIDLPPTVMPLLTPERFTDLRIAFVGGEAFSGELVNRWNPGRRLFNGYGPTECTVTMIVEECSGTWDTSPPIGLPMANHVAHVLDRELRQVPVGVPGELVIGGAGLARGYLNRDELTAEKFIPDPFGTAPGGRLYRTGDLVKRLPDGRLVFLGRIDQQVKIRGLRIELGEVESALATFDGVGPVSVRAWADDSGDKHLVCYLTGVTVERVPTIREHLRALLPSYMIPSYFVVLDELPLTGSGKVDHRRLPAPDRTDSGAGPAGEARTGTERVLLHDLLTPLLRTGRLGVHDDFFLAGGNSLQAVQLMSAIKRRFRVEISLGDFFVSPTVAHLAATVDAARATRHADGESVDTLRGLTGGEDARASVVMRAGGPARLVLLHPSGGELFCYMPVIRALRSGVEVVGFAADPADAAVDPADAMVTTAGRIVRALIAAGPPESWCLAGWSYGGVLAFEVARQIEELTGSRPSLVLLDADPDEDTHPIDEPTTRRRFVHDVARLAGHDDAAVRTVPEDPAAGRTEAGETLRALGVELALTEPELAARYETFRACAQSMQAYRPPGPYGGPVTVLAAGPDTALAEKWRGVCTGRFRVESVPGDHYTLFAEPALSRVVAAIEESLAS